MEKTKVYELTIPIKDFPRISEEANFAEAAKALHQAQENYLSGKGKQRILLVENKQGKILGKLSPLDLMRGLEPQYHRLADVSKSAFVANYEYVIKSMREQMSILEKPLNDLCRKAGESKVKDFLKPVIEAQTIKAQSSLNEALHKFIIGRFDSLFVLDGEKLTGIIKFSDLYAEIYMTIVEECKL